MSDVKSRREMYAEATRSAIIDEATTLFAERGFQATSLEDVAAAAQVTRGAVYHHFSGKRALFEAVAEEQERLIIERVAASMQSHDDAWDGAMAAIDAYTDACLDPVYRTVVWNEGMAALGWDGLHDVCAKYSLAAVESAAKALVEAGYFDSRSVTTVTNLVFHLFGAAAVTLATAEDKATTKIEVADVIKRMIGGLRSTS